MYAVSVNSFLAPNGIINGGFTGIATILNRLFSLPIGTAVFIMNIPLFFLAYKKLGKGFIVKTVFATFTVSFIIDYTSAILPVYSGDRLLSSLFGAVTGGAGLALVFARNATTGGVDTAAKLIKLKHPHLSMGRIILFFDILVVGSSFFVYRSVENLLYSIIVIYLSSKTIDYLLYGTGDGKLIFIVTEHSEEIKEKITKDFRRGVSVLNARGGYTDKEKSVLITAVKIQEAAFITAAVKETDPKAFSVITGADEIIGEVLKSLSDEKTAADIKNADAIVVSVGGNDFFHRKDIMIDALKNALLHGEGFFPEEVTNIYDEYEKNLSRIIDEIKNMNPDAYIIVQTVYNPFLKQTLNFSYINVGKTANRYVTRLNDSIKNVCKTKNRVFVFDVAPEMNEDAENFYGTRII